MGIAAIGSMKIYLLAGIVRWQLAGGKICYDTDQMMTDRGSAVWSNEPQDKEAYTAEFDAFYTRFSGGYDRLVKLLPFWRRWLDSALPWIKGPRVLMEKLLGEFGFRVQVDAVGGFGSVQRFVAWKTQDEPPEIP
jgi:hypothetical protein